MKQEAPVHIPVEGLASVCRRYEVRELVLFGSMLRADRSPESDVDLSVSFQPGARVTCRWPRRNSWED